MARRCRINDKSFEDSYDDDDDEFSQSDDDYKSIQFNDVRRLEDLPWFHGDISRNTAEALLLQNAEEGTYLLRCSGSNVGSFSISARCQNTVKHYSLEYDPYTKSYKFGMGQFPSLAELIDHFNCEPVIGGKSGSPLRLRYQYLRSVKEPDLYETITVQTEVGNNICRSLEIPDFQIASKEGYLVKRGAIRKSWKKRWFILQKNSLKYFKKKDSHDPIATIDLWHATSVDKDDIDGKQNCFKLVLPKRTFYFDASCPEEAESWMKILQWKVDHYAKMMKKSVTI